MLEIEFAVLNAEQRLTRQAWVHMLGSEELNARSVELGLTTSKKDGKTEDVTVGMGRVCVSESHIH